ncbi:MAG: cadherin-like beta sandwich domain-containing protein [Lachnospiraceae bacterium]|nr:cadherin-like beta sandwich domain-containing protein [Lachnospiraceae bacterium]
MKSLNRKSFKLYRTGTVITLMAVLVMFFSGLSAPARARASSADIVISTDTPSVSVGDRVNIFITVTSEILSGNFEAMFTYDRDLFEYLGGPECVAGGDGTLKITDNPEEPKLTERRYALQFKAAARGTGEFGFLYSPELYEYEEGYLMSVAVVTTSVEVTSPVVASSDATLADLRCNPGTLDPEFDAKKTEYKVFVGNETTKLIVSAHASDLASTISLEGNNDLIVGQNRITVTVTAENGNEMKYVIYCVREELPTTPTPEPTVSETEVEADPSMVGLKNIDGVIYIYGRYEFKACELPKDFNLPEGYEKTAVVMNGEAVTAYAKTDAPDDAYLLMVLENENGEPGLYCYDRVEKTIQRFESGSLTSRIAVTANESYSEIDKEVIREYEQKVGVLTFVIIILCALCALLLIFVIRLFLRTRRRGDDIGD